MPDRDAQPRRHWPLGKYGLGIVLTVLFLASWIGQFFVERIQARHEAITHGEIFAMKDFWPEFWQSTLENWQSEFLQLLTFVVLTSVLIFHGSPESRDSDDEMSAALERIEARLDEMQAQQEAISLYQGAGPPG
jgi:hypothetical protein